VKPASFEYHAPDTVSDVVALLAEHGDEIKPLAGGQSLVPMLALRLTRFEHLVDLNRVAELADVSRTNGTLTVGATTRQATVERSTLTDAVPLLTRAAPLIGHFQIRNRGTVGGSLAHADPAAELPAVALALDAQMEIATVAGRHMVPAADFFVGTWTTSLEPNELLAAIHFPVWDGACGFSIDEIARRAGDFALTGAATGVQLNSTGSVQRAAIALFAMGSTPIRAAAAETALVGSNPRTPGDVQEIARLAVHDLHPPDDVHATSHYRRSVGAHVVERSLTRALEEARRA
jgi:aerobic carbon-monoxide dehydrogenase medium subunit